MNLFEAGRRAMEEIAGEADFFEKARKKRTPIAQGECTFAGY